MRFPGTGTAIVLAFACGALARAESCEGLRAAPAPPDTTVSSATEFSAGAYRPEARGTAGSPFPAFCRVTAVARPVPGSEIHLEIWLPAAGAWNGKFLGTGNGGYSGALGYADMERALRQGYATAGSDTGHTGGELTFGAGHPEKIDDWGWRAVHTMTEAAKSLVRAYYGRTPAHAYFTGCSTGGQQALTEAQRFPEDYDGIVAGAPGNNRVRLNVGFLWSWLAAHRDGTESLPPSKLPLLNRAVVAACDGLDGIKDGVIDDPCACRFDPETLLCKGTDTSACLTAAEVASARAIYDGARNPRTGEKLFAGWARGSESSGAPPSTGGWSAYFVGQPEPARADFWRLWVFGNPAWDPRTFNFDTDVLTADRKMAAVVANNPDLTPFQKHGGKLLMYHGWADPVVPPEDGVRYYEDVRQRMASQGTGDFLRLFMVPGMGHCRGGAGPSDFDPLSALDLWVTKGVAPDRIVATRSTNGATDRSRPLCPYPQVARWKGSGSTDDAANFACVAPEAR